MKQQANDVSRILRSYKTAAVEIEVREQSIETKTPDGRMFLTILAAVAQFERDLIVARTKDGLAAARARGRTGGRRPKLSPRKAIDMRERYERGETVQSLAEFFAVSRPTIHRAITWVEEVSNE
ncbi:recombinase family protein [Agreia bicolorata]|uniref:recombinase family protein n=1 Tax=Agreia bicolorata TaxID=110935 RepID=UPI000696D301|nr:recombinase family protein [Agreia bicolorata]